MDCIAATRSDLVAFGPSHSAGPYNSVPVPVREERDKRHQPPQANQSLEEVYEFYVG